jgi:two-component system response regulator PilR (NtrC family)
MRLPDGEGLRVVEHITEKGLDVPVAVITAHGSAENAVAALKAGAFDYLAKPVALEQLRALVKQALKVPEKPSPPSSYQLLGESQAINQVRQMIDRLAKSQAPVFITGESGSGKELAARMIHLGGPRAEQPFVPVNCGAIPENLMESEFFGYKKGAFTGADADREGFFQAANGGTLFLDEVADLPLPMQVKLLRAIQEKMVRKVGSTQEEPVDVRIISATHKKLPALVDAGEFRQDLFYRLHVSNSACRRCARCAKTFRPSPMPSCASSRAPRRRSSTKPRFPPWSRIPSRAMCASWRTSWSADCRWRRIPSGSPPTTCD